MGVEGNMALSRLRKFKRWAQGGRVAGVGDVRHGTLLLFCNILPGGGDVRDGGNFRCCQQIVATNCQQHV